jgi:anti-sigma regulatory factor (Ser/Thr protein kinase)
MTLPSDPRLLAVVRETVSKFAAVWGFAEEQCRAITHAVDEALSNVIRHAYKNRSDQEIEMRLQADGDCLEFTIVDCGEPPDDAKLRAQPVDATALGGRGTYMIRQIMDEVSYEKAPGANRLHLKKRLPGALPSPKRP